MASWRDSRIEHFLSDEQRTYTIGCIVRIEMGRIVVSYDLEGENYIYEGDEIGDGHFHLKLTGGGGEATLHRFKDGKKLDGWWREDDTFGMWRITLSD